jgi:hypothetical protein
MDKNLDRAGPIEADAGIIPDMCLFLTNPSPDCYCMNITGRNIAKIVALCADDYRACPIYRSRGSGQGGRSSAGPRE